MKRSISFRTFTASCFTIFLLIVQLAGAQSSNFDLCKFGMYGCDRSKLSASELATVAEADHQRNFNACKFGMYGCDRSRLDAAEANAVIAQPAAAPTSPGGSSLCAENGSCYGDPNVNGIPKTVHVNGYYRKDGTYVRGHYRSAPGTNPRK